MSTARTTRLAPLHAAEHARWTAAWDAHNERLWRRTPDAEL